MKSTGGNPPPILDPFAGGGTIPFEAQRLGREAHASDLSPVAVLINKALIEFPPKFRDWQPVYPGLAASQIGSWTGSSGLAADVRVEVTADKLSCFDDWVVRTVAENAWHLSFDTQRFEEL